MRRHFSARFVPGCRVSSLPCSVSIRLDADEANSAGVRLIRRLFPDRNPRHPNTTRLPGPAFLVRCQEPAKSLPRFTRCPQTTQATCLFPAPSPNLRKTLLQDKPPPPPKK